MANGVVGWMWWLTVMAYGGTAVLCAIRALQLRPDSARASGIWWLLAASMLLLGINKQANLVGRLTTQGRLLAWAGNWYQARMGVQGVLVGLVSLLTVGLLAVLLWRLRPLTTMQKTAVVGVVYLLGFALLRAVSLHAIDTFLFRPVAGIYPNWVLELGGIALVVVAALNGGKRPLPARAAKENL